MYETATEMVRTEHADLPRQHDIAATQIQDRRHFPNRVSHGARILVAALGVVASAYATNRLLTTSPDTNALSIATFLAFAGGLLSTWSPCGYSSLSLLRPHGHYSIQSVAHWIPTLGTHALGYALATIIFGSGLGLIAAFVPVAGTAGWPLAVVGLIAVGYGLHCLNLIRMPYPQRRIQVSHGARNHYPMWMISLIYGLQLGLNFVTYVRTPILYIVVGLALISGSLGGALWLIGALNLGRWMPLLVNALPIRDQSVQAWLASNEQNARLADGLLLTAAGAAFIVFGLG